MTTAILTDHSIDNHADRDFILAMVRTVKREAHWPGMPVGHIPLHITASLRGMLADGTLTLVKVTKPSKVDPTKTITYNYVTE